MRDSSYDQAHQLSRTLLAGVCHAVGVEEAEPMALRRAAVAATVELARAGWSPWRTDASGCRTRAVAALEEVGRALASCEAAGALDPDEADRLRHLQRRARELLRGSTGTHASAMGAPEAPRLCLGSHAGWVH